MAAPNFIPHFGLPSRLEQMINVAIGAQLFLLLGFDYFPAALRLVLAGGINLLYIFAIVAYLQRTGDRKDLILFLPVGIFVFMGLIGLALEQMSQTQNQASVLAAVRQLSPYVALIALVICRREISPALLAICAFSILASAALHAVFLPNVFLNNSQRFAPFSTNLHASGYALVGTLLLFWFLYTSERLKPVWFILFALVCLFLLNGNGVRTPILFLLFYLGFEMLLSNPFLRHNRSVILVLCAVTLVAVAAVAMTIDLSVFNQFSSGRLSNYGERFDLLNQRDLQTLLFGTGPGSDLLKTSTWWWDEKDSHSDVLKILWGGGVLGLIVFLWFWLLVGLRNQGVLLALSLALLAASCVSNAYLSRPNSAFLLFAFGAARQAYLERKTA
ncbi:hypothetical protein AB9F26_14675 [Falsihalocynthiibacter sp. BN13B15]|uniref:hypothetical protein n=1 Tax=Falsihalocynthiibacter sp. BN13B15 TaxID=3240871 RepID=UPI00350F2BC1